VALLAAPRFPRSTIVATDLTPRMVELAREKEGAERVRWGVADAIALPFPDRSFDVVTSAFMLRNVPDVRRAFAEQWRVLRPGGQSLTLEMCWPDRAPMSVLFHLYFLKWTPLLGGMLSGHREAYTYLPQSVRRFMRPTEVAAVMREVGFREVSWSLRMGGTVALYTGKR
jgi:demethylmenaquinone methyltransferase/2-methoxy-6-polyprenyl-1,4-benzoquinol methylase